MAFVSIEELEEEKKKNFVSIKELKKEEELQKLLKEESKEEDFISAEEAGIKISPLSDTAKQKSYIESLTPPVEVKETEEIKEKKKWKICFH